MKKMIFLLLTAFLAPTVFLASCKDKEEPVIPVLELGETSVVFPATASNKNITVQTNIDTWSASVNGAGSSWCTAKPSYDNVGRFLAVTVPENGGLEERSAEITVTALNLEKRITVRQIGSAPAIVSTKAEYSVSAGSNRVSIPLVANVLFDTLISEPSWVHPVKKESQMKAFVEYTVDFDVDGSMSTEERFCDITFRQKGGEASCTVRIIQAARGSEYTPGGEIGIEGDIEIPVKRGECSIAPQPGADFAKSYDNDMSTMYHSNWSGMDGVPIDLTYYFENVEKMDYLVYYPRTTGSNGNFQKLEILVSTAAEPEFKSIGNFDFGGSGSPTAVPLPGGGLTKPLAVRFTITSGMGDLASCAEMKFYVKNPASDSDLTLFTDQTCSELKPGVTEEMIANMNNEFLQNIAFSLHAGAYPSEFRVQTYHPYAKPEIMAAVNHARPYSLLDNPTGIIATSDREFVVFVGETNGQSLSLRVTDLTNRWAQVDYMLVPGVNRLSITKSGLAYIMYHTGSPAAQPVKIHIASGEVNGYFDIAKHTREQWGPLLQQSKHTHFDVVGKYAHITFTRNDLVANTPDGKRLIEVYDSIVWLEQRHTGLIKYNHTTGNRVYFHTDNTHSTMYASNYRTGYALGSMPALCTVNQLRHGAIWGPAHEVGHVHQIRKGFTWIGMTEVSNNLSSLYVQWKFGNTSRALTDNKYEPAFANMIVGRAPHGTSDIWYKLISLWQLELYYARVKGQTDFYADVYQKIRMTAPDPASDGAAQLNFVKVCCDVAKADLSEYFGDWGMLTPIDASIDDYGVRKLTVTQAQADEVREYAAKYPAPAHKIQYIRDDNYELYRTGAAIVKGTVQKSGLTVTLYNWKNVAACEVYNADGKLVLVTSRNSITMPSGGTKIYAVSSAGDKVEVEF